MVGLHACESSPVSGTKRASTRRPIRFKTLGFGAGRSFEVRRYGFGVRLIELAVTIGRLTVGSECRAQSRLIHWQPQYPRDNRYVVSLNPGAHPISQKLKISAVDRVTARGKKHGVALGKLQTKGVRLRDPFRRRNNQRREHKNILRAPFDCAPRRPIHYNRGRLDFHLACRISCVRWSDVRRANCRFDHTCPQIRISVHSWFRFAAQTPASAPDKCPSHETGPACGMTP